MANAARMLERYMRRTRPGPGADKAAAAYALYAAEISRFHQPALEELRAAGVPPVFDFGYLAYVNAAFALARRGAGVLSARELDLLAEAWATSGLRLGILGRINTRLLQLDTIAATR